MAKYKFDGGAGWLLFWIAVASPIAFFWVLLDMKKREKEDKDAV